MIFANKLVKQKSSNSNYQTVMRYVQLLISVLEGGRKGGSVVINLSGKCSCENHYPELVLLEEPFHQLL